MPRLNKALKELNVGINTVAEFLQKKNRPLQDASPNAKITDEQYELLMDAFGADKTKHEEIQKQLVRDKQERERLKQEKKQKQETIYRTTSESKQQFKVLGNINDMKKEEPVTAKEEASTVKAAQPAEIVETAAVVTPEPEEVVKETTQEPKEQDAAPATPVQEEVAATQVDESEEATEPSDETETGDDFVDGNDEDVISSIALLTNTPSEFSKDYLGQGLDKLLNGVIPTNDSENYTLVFLAESLTQDNIREIISAYEEMATAIAPYLQYQFQVGQNDTETSGEMNSLANSESVSDSVFKSHSINIGISGGVGMSRGTSSSNLAARFKQGVGGLISGAGAGAMAGAPVGGIGAVPGAIAGALVGGLAGFIASPNNKNSGISGSLGLNAGYGYSWGTSKTTSKGEIKTTGTNKSISTGTSESSTYTYKSYMVNDLLDKLETTISRINKSQATGLWKYSTFVLSYDSKTAISVANFLKGITQGKESFIEPAVVQEWSRQGGNASTPFDEIKKYLSHFTHPIFITADEAGKNEMIVTGTSYVATDELSNVIAFPKKSLQGLPVLEGVQFGREANSLSLDPVDLEIGQGYHMHQVYSHQRIKLSTQELRSHTFITGSTGSGKSNTIYTLLNALTGETHSKSINLQYSS